MRKNSFAWLITLLFALTFIPACGGGSGGGGAGGDGSTRTMAINLDQFNDGDLATYTKEIYTFSVPANTDMFISVELYGSRLDQAAWTDSTFNAPVITLVDESVIGGTEILQHNIDAASWIFGNRDTEIPLYLLQNSSPVSSKPFSIQITRTSPSVEGGPYKIRVNNVSSDILSQFGATNIEAELPGGNTNDDETASELIVLEAGKTDAVVFGHYDDASPDYFKFNIAPDLANNSSITISCFEVISNRNGMGQFQTDYFDPELTLHREISPVGPSVEPTSNLVDDGYFLDPKLCRKISATDTYYIEINETSAIDPSDEADYILKYTEERIPDANTVLEAEPNDQGNPISIADEKFITGSLNPASDTDWFFFSALNGDMVRIRQFDGDLADDSTSTVSIELFDSIDSINPLPFTGPAQEVQRTGLYPNMTTTSLIVQGDGFYRLKVSEYDTSDSSVQKDYSFYLEIIKQSDFETVPEQDPGNDDHMQADTFLNGRASGLIDTSNDVDFFEIDATELGLLGVVDGDLIAVHVYAAKDVDLKSYDESGYGSTLEPKLTIYDNTVSTPITTSRYIDDTTSDTASEGIRAPFPTLTAVFTVDIPTIPAYLISVENGGTYDGTSPSYMIEIENLGQ